jgi:hypothetical protein
LANRKDILIYFAVALLFSAQPAVVWLGLQGARYPAVNAALYYAPFLGAFGAGFLLGYRVVVPIALIAFLTHLALVLAQYRHLPQAEAGGPPYWLAVVAVINGILVVIMSLFPAILGAFLKDRTTRGANLVSAAKGAGSLKFVLAALGVSLGCLAVSLISARSYALALSIGAFTAIFLAAIGLGFSVEPLFKKDQAPALGLANIVAALLGTLIVIFWLPMALTLVFRR